MSTSTAHAAAAGTTPQNLTWSSVFVSPTHSGDQVTALATSDFSGPIDYSVTGSCTISGSVITADGEGTCNVTATAAGDDTYADESINASFTTDLRTQTIQIDQPGLVNFTQSQVTLNASTDSGLPVSISVSPANVCSVNLHTITFNDAGTCEVTATSNGNNFYYAATPVIFSFQIFDDRPYPPGSPTDVYAVKNNDGSVTVNWTQPTNSGSQPIDSFEVHASNGALCVSNGNSCTIQAADLPASGTVTFSVTAHSAAGYSDPSAANNSIKDLSGTPWDDQAGGQAGCGIDANDKVFCFGTTPTPPSDLPAATQVEVGTDFACALDMSNTVRCWGAPGAVRSTVPAGLQAKYLSVEHQEVCVIKVDDTVLCWGNDEDGNSFRKNEVPADLGKVISLSNGSFNVCAVKEDHSVVCWGAPYMLPNVPTTKNFKSVSVGYANACAITTNDSVKCWGMGGYLPNNSEPPLSHVLQVEVGVSTACARLSGGIAKCWGNNWGATNLTGIPAKLGPVVDIVAAEYTTCFLMASGQTRCFGDAGHFPIPAARAFTSSLYFGDVPNRPENVLVTRGAKSATVTWTAATTGSPATTYVVVANGEPNICTADANATTCTVTGLRNGYSYSFEVYAVNDFGYSAKGTSTKFKKITSMRGASWCGIDLTDHVQCWSSTSDVGSSYVPGDLGTVIDVATIGEYDQVGCAIKTNGKIRCWGNSWGMNQWNQIKIPTIDGFTKIAGTTFAACALRGTRQLYCWGHQWWGDIPNSGYRTYTEDVVSLTGTFASAICVTFASGANECYGGQLNRDIFAAIPATMKTVVALNSNIWCGIQTDDTVACGGYTGNTANGIPDSSVQAKSISIGNQEPCIIKFDDSVYCWGYVDSWQGTTVPQTLTSAKSVVGTMDNTNCAISDANDVVCWGYASGDRTAPSTVGAATPGDVPSAPLGVRYYQATDGLHVSWKPPAETGGYDVSGYRAVALPSNIACETRIDIDPDPYSCVIGGLTEGTEYTLSVQAINYIGNSSQIATNTVTAASTMGDSACAIDNNAHVQCWGSATNRLITDQPADSVLGHVTQLTVSYAHACILNDAAEVHCWGTNDNERSAVPSADILGTPIQVEAGAAFTCVLNTAKQVHCWGYDESGIVSQLPDEVNNGQKTIDHIRAKYSSMCVIYTDYTYKCWGGGVERLAPSDLGPVKDIRMDYWNTCALTITDVLRCWGDASYGSLESTVIGTKIKAFDEFRNQICAITLIDQLTCWGRDNYVPKQTFVNLSRITDVSVGDNGVCAIHDGGQVWCYGVESLQAHAAPLYQSSLTYANVPSVPTNVITVRQGKAVKVRWEAPENNGGSPITNYRVMLKGTTNGCYVEATIHECLITGLINGHKYSFEVTAVNQAGSSLPAKQLKFLKIHAGDSHSWCGQDINYELHCWTTDRNSPTVNVPDDLGPIKDFAMSFPSDDVCAVKNSGAVVCWGTGTQIENGEYKQIATGVFDQVAGSFDSYCGLRTNKSIVCWGTDQYGRISDYPRGPDAPTNIVKLVSTVEHTFCALLDDGGRKCWGSYSRDLFDNAPKVATAIDGSSSSQVSDMGLLTYGYCMVGVDHEIDCQGNSGYTFIQQKPTTDIRAKSLTMSNDQVCIVKTDDTAYCWGAAANDSNVIPADLGTVTQVIPTWNRQTTCALRTDQTIQCWGYTGDGRNIPSLGVEGYAGDLPAAPVDVIKTVVAGGYKVYWKAPLENGGFPITGYRVVATPGNHSCATSVTDRNPYTCVVTGLDAGTTYDVQVHAVNDNGDSLPVNAFDKTVKIATMGDDTCALSDAGKVTCWGSGTSADRVTGGLPSADVLGHVVDISVGYNFACAINNQQQLKCWGYDEHQVLSQMPDSSVIGTPVHVATGLYNICVSNTDQQVICWGYNGFGVNDVPSDVNIPDDSSRTIADLVVNIGTPCVTYSNHTFRCWGSNDRGLVSDRPADVTLIKNLSISDRHICVVKMTGTISCWGANDWGEISSMPNNLKNVAEVKVAPNRTCAIKSDTTFVCWGDEGSYGTGTYPVGVTGVSQMSLSWTQTCFVYSDGEVGCGSDANWRVQIPQTLMEHTSQYVGLPDAPANVIAVRGKGKVTIRWTAPENTGGADILGYRARVLGASGQCEVQAPTTECTITGLTNGRYYAFALQARNLSGYSTYAGALKALEIASTNGDPWCAIDENHKVHCWVSNTDNPILNDVDQMPAMRHIAVGSATGGGCGILMTGGIKCWGNGPGVTDGWAKPTQTDFVQIAATYFSYCALRENGEVACWGYDHYGQISQMPNFNQPVTKIVGNIDHHYCAILQDKTVQCWGNLNADAFANLPTDVIDFSATTINWCAIHSDHTVECGGLPSNGNYSVTTNMPTSTQLATSVELGLNYGCVILQSDGSPYCWGSTDYRPETPPAGLHSLKQLVVSNVWTACAILADNSISCWGYPDDRTISQVGIATRVGEVPEPPTNVTYSFTSTGIKVRWWESTNAYNLPVSGYRAVVQPGNHVCSTSVSAADPYTCTITGLTASSDYHLTVQAENEAGFSNASIAYEKPIQIRSTGENRCAITQEHRVRCWGYWWNSLITQLPSDDELGVVTDLQLSFGWACALNSAKHVLCWGTDSYSLSSGIPSAIQGSVEQIGVGYSTACALTTDDHVTCWGSDQEGLNLVPDSVNNSSQTIVKLRVNAYTGCVVYDDNTYECWGRQFTGKPDSVTAITDIGVDEGHMCVLNTNGSPVCWGSDNNWYMNSNAPQITGAKQLSVGYWSACVIDAHDMLRCWGRWDWNQTNFDHVTQGAKQVAAGAIASCAILLDDSVTCTPGEERRTAVPQSLTKLDFTFAHAPSAPRNVVAIRGDRQVTLTWDAPESSNGSALLGYRARVNNNSSLSCLAGANEQSCTITGLTNGVEYKFDVRARNAIGFSVHAGAIKVKKVISNRDWVKCAILENDNLQCWSVNSNWRGLNVPSSLGGVKDASIDRDGRVCAIKLNGKLRCWGEDTYGNNYASPLDPDGVSLADLTLVSISSGQYHFCVVDSSADVHCWGYGGDGQLDVPGDLHNVAKVASGARGSCALSESGQVTCWGQTPAVPGDLEALKDVSVADHNSACGVLLTGAVRCWGENYAGLISNAPSITNAVSVTQVQPEGGAYTMCALLDSGEAKCLGDWSDSYFAPPISVGLLKQVSIAWTLNACGLSIDNDIECWGYEADGRTAVPTMIAGSPGSVPSEPVNVRVERGTRGAQISWSAPVNNGGFALDQYKVVASPTGESCYVNLALEPNQRSCVIEGLTPGSTYSFRVLAHNVNGWSVSATASNGAVQVATHNGNTCVVLQDTTVQCWGYIPQVYDNIPAGLTGVTKVVVTDASACALKSDGTIVCWGDGGWGRTSAPVGSGFKDIAANKRNVCAVQADDLLNCWGSWDWSNQNWPRDMHVKSMTTSEVSFCAISTDDTGNRGQCWGDAGYWGMNDHIPNEPLQALSADGLHVCWALANKSFDCWARWDNSGIMSEMANQTGLDDVVDIQMFVSDTCVIRSDHTHACWGRNDNGRNSLTATNATYATQLSSGANNICLINLNHQLVCAGINDVTNAVPQALNIPTLDMLKAPSAPLNQVLSTATGSLVASWDIPAENGGAEIDGYHAWVTPGGFECFTLVTDVNPLTCQLSGGDPTQQYELHVTAHNVVGDSLDVTFIQPGAAVLSEGIVRLQAKSNDSNHVSISANTPEVCGVTTSGLNNGYEYAEIALRSIGDCSVTATVPGGAASITRTFAVTAPKATRGLAVKYFNYGGSFEFTEQGRTPCYTGFADLLDTNVGWTRDDATSPWWNRCDTNQYVAHYQGMIKWPGASVGDQNSVSFTGSADDIMTMRINGQVVVANSGGSGQVSLITGQYYPVDVWFGNTGGPSSLRLLWTHDDVTNEIVPASAFTSGDSLPKATPTLTWDSSVSDLTRVHVGQEISLSAHSNEPATNITYSVGDSTSCSITGDLNDHVVINDQSSPCDVTAISAASDVLLASAPITKRFLTLPGMTATINQAQTSFKDTVVHYENNRTLDGQVDGNINTRWIYGSVEGVIPADAHVDIYCVSKDPTLAPLQIADYIPVDWQNQFAANVSDVHSLGAMAGCKLAAVADGDVVAETWNALTTEVQLVDVAVDRDDTGVTGYTVDVWGTKGRTTIGSDILCPMCYMTADNGSGSFAVAGQTNPLVVSDDYKFWQSAAYRNPFGSNDNFKFVDANNPANTVDYSDFIVDGNPVYTETMAIDYPELSGTVRVQNQTLNVANNGDVTVTNQSPLLRCANDGEKISSANCGSLVDSGVHYIKESTVKLSGNVLAVKESFESSDNVTHNVTVSSQANSTQDGEATYKITSGVAETSTEFASLEQGQNYAGTGGTFTIEGQFDNSDRTANNSTFASAAYWPNPTRFVSAVTGANPLTANGYAVVYDSKPVTSGNPLQLFQAYSLSPDLASSADDKEIALAFVDQRPPVLSNSISVTTTSDVTFDTGTTFVYAETTSGLPLAFTSTDETICTVGGIRTVYGQTRASITFQKIGECQLTISQAGDDTHTAAVDASTSFSITESSPDAPTDVIATPNNSGALIEWTPPINSGGSAIKQYTVHLTDGDGNTSTYSTALTDGETPTQLQINGLDRTTFDVTVTATNSDDLGNLSMTSIESDSVSMTLPANEITLDAESLSATFADGSIDVGAIATSGLDVVYASTDESVCTVGSTTTTDTHSVATVTFVSAGSCTVTADQTGDDVYPEAESKSITISIGNSEPDYPHNLRAQFLNGKATFNWDEGNTNGGTRIISYKVTATSGTEVKEYTVNQVGSSLARTVDALNLTPGKTYVVKVKAFNQGLLGDDASDNLSSEDSPTINLEVPSIAYWSGLGMTITDTKKKPALQAKVGFTLTALPGTWTLATGLKPVYQWYDCSKAFVAAGGSVPVAPPTSKCVAIKKATAVTYKPVKTDVGKFITFSITYSTKVPKFAVSKLPSTTVKAVSK